MSERLTGLAPPSCPERTPDQSPAFSGRGPAGPAEMSTPLQPPALNLQDRVETDVNQLEDKSGGEQDEENEDHLGWALKLNTCLELTEMLSQNRVSETVEYRSWHQMSDQNRNLVVSLPDQIIPDLVHNFASFRQSSCTADCVLQKNKAMRSKKYGQVSILKLRYGVGTGI